MKGFLDMDGISKSTSISTSSYYSLDDKTEKEDVTYLNRNVSLVSKEDVFMKGSQLSKESSEFFEKKIDNYKIERLDRNDSGQFSISDDLKFTKELGEGGFGVVWLVDSCGENNQYAFKLPFVAQHLKPELDKMDKVGHHPNLIKSFGIAEVGGKEGILMEYIPGEDLSKLLPEITEQYLQGTLSHSNFWGIIQFILKGILSGLSYLEQQGYAHQDIKPQNIRIHEEKLIPIIIDFGSLAEFGEKGKIGTELYSTPESFSSCEGAEVFDKCDTYSIGQMTYSLLSNIINPGVENFFTAGAKYDDLKSSERMGLLFRLHLAMKKFQEVESSGVYQKALNPISQDELDNIFKNTDQEELTKALGKEYDKAGNEGVPLDFMLEKLSTTLVRENMVGHYRAGYESSLVKFINLSLHPNPDLRINATDALRQEFITDPLIDDQYAKKIIGDTFQMRFVPSPWR